MPSIAGQSVLVLGGSAGIGAAVAKLAVSEGSRVAIASSNANRVANAISELKQSIPDAQVSGHTCDLLSEDVEAGLEKLLAEVTTTNGGLLNHIVYTAASVKMKPLSELSSDYLRNSGQQAFVAPLLLAKMASRFLHDSHTSSLTFTSGRVAERPSKGFVVGAAWGSSLIGITKTLALELAPKMRVNLVSPGATETTHWDPDEGVRTMIREKLLKDALLGKIGSVEEVAEAYIYLMKDSNITGTNIQSSGGWLLQ